jgi:hypothetical protein
MSTVNRENLIFFFLPNLDPFYFLLFFIDLARNSKIILNRRGESRKPYFFPDFNGNGFICSPLV